MNIPREQSRIRVTLQACLDAGAEPEQLAQIVDLFRHQWMDEPAMRLYIDDMEVRYVTSLAIPGTPEYAEQPLGTPLQPRSAHTTLDAAGLGV